MKTCDWCKRPIVRLMANRRKYCRRACRDQAYEARKAALSSSPRPQEPQPPEPPKPTEPCKPVVDLMEALKKSLDSLNAKRTQEPGGHQP